MPEIVRSAVLRWTICVALTGLGFTAQANPSIPGVSEIEFGYFCAIKEGTDIVAENTIEGTVRSIGTAPEFLRRGTTVPARLGIEFGVLVQVMPGFEGPVTIHVEHPPQTDHGITHESWAGNFSADRLTYVGFGFEYEYELTPGPWTLSATSDNDLIYEITFDVVAADSLPAGGLSCGLAPQIS